MGIVQFKQRGKPGKYNMQERKGTKGHLMFGGHFDLLQEPSAVPFCFHHVEISIHL